MTCGRSHRKTQSPRLEQLSPESVSLPGQDHWLLDVPGHSQAQETTLWALLPSPLTFKVKFQEPFCPSPVQRAERQGCICLGVSQTLTLVNTLPLLRAQVWFALAPRPHGGRTQGWAPSKVSDAAGVLPATYLTCNIEWFDLPIRLPWSC